MRHPPDYPAKTLVTAQWQWSGYSAPDQDNKEINVDIAVVLRWRDDRVNPELGRSVNMTEGAWTARGLWLPTLRFDYLKSNTSTSSVIHFEMLRPSARPDGVYTPDEGWCTWSFAYGPATFEWSDQPRGFELNWELFPFGQQRMRLGMQCTDELVDCSLFDLNMSQGRAPQPQNGTAPSGRRLLQAQRRAASGAAATTYLRASSSLAVPRTFPLVEHLSTPANTPSPDVNLERTPVRFEMTIVMSRQPLTYVLRLIVPMVLVGFLALLTFFVKENYTQLELCFTALLLLALLGIEVKDFMPDHVIGLTWLDAFVTINICIMVVTTLMSLFIIVFDESENERMKAWAEAIDTTVRQTFPITAVAVNGAMLAFAATSEVDDSMGRVEHLVANAFIVWVVMLLLSLLFIFRRARKVNGVAKQQDAPLQQTLPYASTRPEFPSDSAVAVRTAASLEGMITAEFDHDGHAAATPAVAAPLPVLVTAPAIDATQAVPTHRCCPPEQLGSAGSSALLADSVPVLRELLANAGTPQLLALAQSLEQQTEGQAASHESGAFESTSTDAQQNVEPAHRHRRRKSRSAESELVGYNFNG